MHKKFKNLAFILAGKDKDMLETYSEMLSKFKNLIGKLFCNEPAHDNKYFKTKIRFSRGEIKVGFYDEGQLSKKTHS